MADLKKYITEPGLVFEGFFRQVSSYSVFQNKSEFKVKVLTNPIPYTGPDPDIETGDPLSDQKSQKYWFKGRILDPNMAHEKFLPDPCDNTIAADPEYAQALTSLHATIFAEAEPDCKIGDIILAFAGPGDNNKIYNLQHMKWIKTETKNSGPLVIGQECFKLSDYDFADSNFLTPGTNIPYEDISEGQKSLYNGRLVLNGRLEEGYIAVDAEGNVKTNADGQPTFERAEPPIVVSPWTDANQAYVPKTDRSGRLILFIKEATGSFQRLCKAYYEEFNTKIVINDSYRDYARQEDFEVRYNGATPGHSNHGWGVAFDINGTNVPIGRFKSPIYLFLDKNNTGTEGFRNPPSLRENGSLPEAWHWENTGVRGEAYDNPITQPIGTIPDGAEPPDGDPSLPPDPADNTILGEGPTSTDSY